MINSIEYRLPICPSCGSNREELKEMLSSPNIWIGAERSAEFSYTGFWGKSDEAVRAETIIYKCSLCTDYFTKVRRVK